MTAGPAARIGELLGLYRPVADELFVAVDDRAAPEVAQAAAAAGARVVLYPYAEPVDRPLAWLHHECRGDWVLTIDDDEIPSAGLLAELPRLVESRELTHYRVPRRWLFPAPGRFLDESPWRPDYQLRLVRNDPRLLLFFEETHRPIEVLGPGRYLELPIYHADCVINSEERREQKALKYERLRPGKRVAGGAMSHVFYLPERRPSARTLPLPEEDVRLVERVLGAADVPLRPPESLRAATRTEIDRHWVGRELPLSAYAARIELLQQPERLVAGEQRTLDARLSNLGGERWPWGEHGLPAIRVGDRWHAPGSTAVTEGLRTPFPADVAPGEDVVLPVHVLAPPDPGRHVLELDLVHEHVRWFGCAVRLEVEVLRPRRVAILAAGVGAEDVLERLAGVAPELEPVVLGEGAPAGHRWAPGPDAFLREGPPSRLVLRTLALLGAARLTRGRGRPPARPRQAAPLLRALGGAQLLVLAAPAEGGRALWTALSAALAAQALGVPVVLAGEPPRPGPRPLRRLLGRALARAAPPRPLEAAAREAAGRTQ
jgi:hypothetical protein